MKFNIQFFGKILLILSVLFVMPFCVKKETFIKQSEAEVIFTNKSSLLKINKDSWKISLLNSSGEEQFIEASPPSFQIDEEWISLRKIVDVKPTNNKLVEIKAELTNGTKAAVLVNSLSDYAFGIEIRLDEKEASAIRGFNKLHQKEEVYGFGEMWNGHVAQRGQSFVLWDQTGTPDECAYMPYYVTTNNYAFFLDYGGSVKVDVGKTDLDRIVYEAPTSEFSITLVSGNKISEAVRNFFSLNGMPTLPPRWAFQPWFWMIGRGTTLKTNWDKNHPNYKGNDVVKMAKRYRELDIPVGVCWFEPPWQTARNSFEAREYFTNDFKALIDELHQLNFKVLAWTTPYTSPSSPNWQEGIDKGYIFGEPKDEITADKDPVAGENGYNYIDFTNPEARKWWQEEITKALNAGLDGFKLDAGQKLPDDVILHNGKLGKDFHNAYALYFNRTFFEILSEKYGNNFLMIPRAAWIGSGSYTNFKWPGDLNCTFDDNGLPAALYSMLSLSFCGLPYLATDIGGYAGKNPEENVWVRWAQLGTFMPGMQTLYMPWWYSDKALKHYRYLSYLHTELIPFWMSLAHESHETGAPICRPLVWTFQDDINSWRVDNEYTLGESFLIAPVITPENEREVYIPPGVWHDFWDNSKSIQGPAEINWKGDLWHFPLYIKAGAIIPMEVSRDMTVFGWTESADYITIAIWPSISEKSQFRLHDREEPVIFDVQMGENEDILLKWSQSAEDYLFRIHWKSGNSIKEITAGKGEKRISLSKAKDLLSFRKSKEDEWFLDEVNNKLWIRKSTDEYSGEIRIY